MVVEITSTIHVSNRCSLKRKCAYCGFAAGSSPAGYYKSFVKTEDEILKAALSIEFAGIKRVSISAGYGNFSAVLKAVQIVKEKTGLEVLVNVGGDINEEELELLKSAGVETVCCNLETVNRELFERLKPDDSFEKRLKVCELVKEFGLKLSSGLLLGIGESERDRKEHIKLLKSLEVDEVPVMGFRPYPGTPMESVPPAPLTLQLRVIERVRKVVDSCKRLTVPYPTVGKEGVIPAVRSGANNVATVVPENYPLTVKGVGSPQVGILEELLNLFDSFGIETNVERERLPL